MCLELNKNTLENYKYKYLLREKVFGSFWQNNFCVIAKARCFRIYYKIAMKK